MISNIDANARWEVLDMITDFAFNGELADFSYSQVAKAVFCIIKPKLAEEIEKQDAILLKRRESGKLGGLAKATKCQAHGNQMVADGKQVVASAKQVLPSATKEQKRTVFVKPTIEEIRAYIAEKGYHFSAEQFFAFYESKGWKVGSQPMKDWKMVCVTWEGRTGNRAQKPSQSQQPRKTTFNDWNSSEALTEQYKIDEERRMKQQDDEEKEERVRSFQVQILDYFSRHRDDYKTLEQGDVKENDYFTITGLPDGTMYWNCKCANCKRRTYYDEAMKCVNECPLDAPMRPKGDKDTSYIWDKVSKMWVIY